MWLLLLLDVKELSCCPPERAFIYPITKLPIYQITQNYFLVNTSSLPYPLPHISH